MPGHGTRKNKKSCGSHGGTRKQRGGFGFLKNLAKKASEKITKAKTAIAAHPMGEKLNAKVAKHITAAKAAAAAVAAHPHAVSVKNKMNAGIASLTQIKDQAMSHPITQQVKSQVGQHLDKLHSHVTDVHNMAKAKMSNVMSKMGGRKKRGHKKRHATKKRGHKKHGHKKRHATKKRGHKKRKQRGGKCNGPNMPCGSH